MQATHRRRVLADLPLSSAAPSFEGYLGIPVQLLLKHLVIASVLGLVASLLMIPNLKTFLAGSVGAVVLMLPLFESGKGNLRNLLSRLPRVSLAICLLVALYMLAATLSTIIQTYEEGGIMMAVIHGAANPLLAATCLTACLACSHHSPTHGLLLLAMTVAFICFGNQLADVLGIGSEFLKSREAFWASRYLEGSFRWQSPLISSWQLSGLGRWAMPLLLVPMLLTRGSSRTVLTVFLSLAAVVAAALVRVEFRAAVFPLLGFVGWSLCRGQRLRGVLAASMYAYMIIAPFIFGNPAFLDLAERLIPEFIIRLSGSSLESILSLTDRTTLWLVAMEDLTAGHTLLSGQGYYGLDASIFGAWDLGVLASLIFKYSFHQGFLDLCFVYGSFWAVVFVIGVSLSFCTVVKPTHPLSPRSLGWLSLGLIGLSNCHDGFFTPNFMFFTITLFSVICTGSPDTNYRNNPDEFPESHDPA